MEVSVLSSVGRGLSPATLATQVERAVPCRAQRFPPLSHLPATVVRAGGGRASAALAGPVRQHRKPHGLCPDPFPRNDPASPFGGGKSGRKLLFPPVPPATGRAA